MRAPSSAARIREIFHLPALLEAIRNAAAAGAAWIQIREKDLEARELAELVRLAVEDHATGQAREFW